MEESDYILGVTQRGDLLRLSRADARTHVYITGKSGTGKSSLLFAMAETDMRAGRGFLFLDPHGDTAQALADVAPAERRGDILYFDPLDETHVMGFNPLLHVPPLLRGTVATRIVEAFRNIWAESWGPRLDYTLTNAIRLLLENPSTCLTDIPRLLVDDRYRSQLLRNCQDHFIHAYWTKEYGAMPDRLRAEVIAPIQNKVGVFANNPILRHVLSGKATLDPQRIMERGQVLICNLSKRMGEEPSRLLGALLITAFAQSAEARAGRPEEERGDFTIYVDEFQSFVTDAIATILSEARKYRLSLIAANQFLGQVPELLRQAIIGNAATLIAFRVGAFDAPLLAREMDVPEATLINQSNHAARVKRIDGGSPTEATYIETLKPEPLTTGRLAAVIANTQARYAHRRDLT